MEMKLTPITGNSELSDSFSNDTVSLIEHGLRAGCSNSEYNLALRLQEMRKIAFALAEAQIAEGYVVSDEVLSIIDILKETIAEVRMKK